MAFICAQNASHGPLIDPQFDEKHFTALNHQAAVEHAISLDLQISRISEDTFISIY